MKKIKIIITVLLLTNFSFGQAGFQKGNLFGLHLVTVNLKPNATIEQFKTFFTDKVIPEYEKTWVGLKGYLVRSVRGEYKNSFAIVWLFESEAARDRYFNADGTMNELEKAANEKVKPIEEELKKYGAYTIQYKDDWVVQ